MDVQRYTVGELAKRSGVNARVIRRYDAVGLLKPGERSGAGYRLYEEADVRRLDLIVALRAVGYGIREIRKILDGDNRQIRSVVERGAQVMKRESEERLQKTPLPDLLRLVSELTPHDPDKAAKRLLQSARRARVLAD